MTFSNLKTKRFSQTGIVTLILCCFVFALSVPLASADKSAQKPEPRPRKLNLARTWSQPGGQSVEVRFPKGEPKLAREFSLIVCQEGLPAPLKPDFLMPEHLHGMSAIPKSKAGQKEGKEKTCTEWTGLKLSMSGWWRLRFALPLQNKTEETKVDFDFDIKP